MQKHITAIKTFPEVRDIFHGLQGHSNMLNKNKKYEIIVIEEKFM